MTAVAERFKFTVDRRTWLRGEGSAASRLLRPSDGKMCCMGSYCLARGITTEAIDDIASIISLQACRHVSGLMGWEGALQSTTKCNVYDINDRPDIDDATREKELTEALAPYGVDIEFTN